MGFGFTITDKGKNYLLNLQVDETFELDSIMVGDGVLPTGTPANTLTDLINPLYYATSTVPTVTDNVLRMTVEFRNRIQDLFPHLPIQDVTDDFDLTEFGIFVRNSSNERILLYYGDLSDFPEPVIAFNPMNPFTVVKRYPIMITLVEGKIKLHLGYLAAAFITHEELMKILAGLKTEVVAYPFTIPISAWLSSVNPSFTYQADIPIDVITSNHLAVVGFDTPSVLSARNAGQDGGETLDGILRLFSNSIPLTILSGDVMIAKREV